MRQCFGFNSSERALLPYVVYLTRRRPAPHIPVGTLHTEYLSDRIVAVRVDVHLPTAARQVRVPKVDEEDGTVDVAAMVDFVLPRVVEDNALALVPRAHLLARADRAALRHEDPEVAGEPRVCRAAVGP